VERWHLSAFLPVQNQGGRGSGTFRLSPLRRSVIGFFKFPVQARTQVRGDVLAGRSFEVKDDQKGEVNMVSAIFI